MGFPDSVPAGYIEIAAVLTLLTAALAWFVASSIHKHRLHKRTTRDARIEEWSAFAQVTRDYPQLQWVMVEKVYQVAATGTKAIVVWPATGARHDAWFEGVRYLTPGMHLLLSGHLDYGPHNDNPAVLFTSHERVAATAPDISRQTWHKHADRQQFPAPALHST